MIKIKGDKGFTLIELLMVIAIIGILAAVAIPMYKTHIIRARMVEALNVISHIAQSMESIVKKRRLMEGEFRGPTALTLIQSEIVWDYRFR